MAGGQRLQWACTYLLWTHTVVEQPSGQDSIQAARTEQASVLVLVGLVIYWLCRWEMQLWSQAAWVEISAHSLLTSEVTW